MIPGIKKKAYIGRSNDIIAIITAQAIRPRKSQPEPHGA
jgi:hypothetical protein